MQKSLAALLAASLLSANALGATQACNISTAMETAQKAERDRRMKDIDNRLLELNKLNELMNACLNNFPSMPTSWGSSALLTQAFQQVRQKVCEGLVDKAKNNYQQALNDAQNAGTSALNGQNGTQPGTMLPNMPNLPGMPTNTSPTNNLPTALPTTNQTTSNQTNTWSDMMKRFFQ